jgi:hypothetical protein
VVEMNDDAKDARMERLQATLRRLKQVQDAFPPGLRETPAAVDRLTAPTRERRKTIADLLSGDHLSVVRAVSLPVGPVDSLHEACPHCGADCHGVKLRTSAAPRSAWATTARTTRAAIGSSRSLMPSARSARRHRFADGDRPLQPRRGRESVAAVAGREGRLGVTRPAPVVAG